ncbi:unnamed protein product (mitochondrion) [Plasmodiophora brassicae]|uniref:No apical meristem-associated C-terminal domain-containing protein n=1 Tax=Plasmodiophora brassicae TaxID=37360 RepID=A0A0G4J711_PLABS|nr:hypothetical protein PBRA_003067 [Plasmodiophora brassicae]SPQ95546.1 unnamed protein product [Plasmodiophora brassicae]
MPSSSASQAMMGSEAKRHRGTNFTDAEDVQLARSWLSVSRDSATGSGQPKDAFWIRVEAHFCRNTTGGVRSARSLQTKWSTIQRGVSKFAAAFASVKALDESGADDEEQISKAMVLYQQTSPRNASFGYLHCWRALRTMPKWQDLRSRQETNPSKNPQTKIVDNKDVAGVGNASSTQVSNRGTKLDENRVVAPPAQTLSGRTASVTVGKARKKLAEHAALQSAMAQSMAARAAAFHLQTQMSLFTVDLDSLDPDGQEYLRLARLKALEDVKRSMVQIERNGPDGDVADDTGSFEEDADATGGYQA